MAKQVCDLRAGKGMSIAQSNEHLRVGQEKAYMKKITGTQDPTREHLNFEIGRGGVVKEVDKGTSIPSRIKEILRERGIIDPNAGLAEDNPRRRRTVANIILQGSRDIMRRLAFGDQKVNYERGADNSQVTRNKDIERWAVDMYRFMADRYGEDNIAAFVCHLDETNPHIHCTLLPITEKNKFSYNQFFGGNKEDGAKKFTELHDELAKVNAKYGLERGDSIATTGAKHKSMLQWLKEQEASHKETISQQEDTIRTNTTQIIGLNAAIRHAKTRLKGLTTMVQNLEAHKEAVQAELKELMDKQVSAEEIKAKREEYERIVEKLADKTQKLRTAKEELEKLLKDETTLESTNKTLLTKNEVLQSRNNALQKMIDRDQDEGMTKAMQDMVNTFFMMAQEEIAKEQHQLKDFERELPYQQQKELERMLDGSYIETMAECADNAVAVAATLYFGFIKEAIDFAESHGGGGTTPDSGWGREKDEDDEAYKRRCCIMGRAMMRPAGRKLKRS